MSGICEENIRLANSVYRVNAIFVAVWFCCGKVSPISSTAKRHEKSVDKILLLENNAYLCSVKTTKT